MLLAHGLKYASLPMLLVKHRLLILLKVAVDHTRPNGRVLGIDIIPAQPPKGVSTIQGNFLSPAVQEEVKNYLRDSDRGRARTEISLLAEDGEVQMTKEDLECKSTSYLELEKRAENVEIMTFYKGKASEDEEHGRVVDVVISDMSEPWGQTEGFWKRSLSDPYYRMMNTSGLSFKDHAGSMVQISVLFDYVGYLSLGARKLILLFMLQDLCDAALRFAFDTLRTGGHFVCKFYQGAEDKALERRLKTLFARVHREKPESSRSVRPMLGLFVRLTLRC